MSKIERGEIYYIYKTDTYGSEQESGRPAVIVSNNAANKNSEAIEVVYLTTQPKPNLPTHVTIRSSKKISTALCEQITSVSVDRLGGCSGTCTAREMQAIDIALAISLAIGDESISPVATETASEECTEACNNELYEQERQQRIVAETQRDVYRQMYEELLNKAINTK